MKRQAHPGGQAPDSLRDDLQACALAIAVLVVLTILATAWPELPR